MNAKDPAAFLDQTSDAIREQFADEKSLLGFGEYLEVAAADPVGQTRDAARYLRDVFDHYGSYEVQRPYGRWTRYRLFDAPFAGGEGAVLGHEAVQARIYGLLTDFVRQGRVSKLILLHGPNGSAKSSLINCLIGGLQDYSATRQGALYTFNWVFPAAKMERSAIGFGGARGIDGLSTYAHLAEGDVDARLRVETRDHPLLLLPRAQRVEWLRGLLGADASLPRSLLEGELSPKARQVFDALMRAYKGDLREVLKHVQVERFRISHRYRRGAVTVDPQMRVDAGVRQVTADRSLGSLPPSLQNEALYEPMGDLVDANRGLIEYNDLLKRPVEAFKYLLATCEHGAVRLDTMTLHLDTVFVGSCNAAHLDAFKEMPDFASFKARIELVQVPYLIDFEQEKRIYHALTQGPAVERPVAPHTDEVAALWAVLTRLERPKSEAENEGLRKAINGLAPVEKAELYALGRAPRALAREVRAELVAHAAELYEQTREERIYEGRVGASPREIKMAMLAAARRPGHACLSPVALLEDLRDLCAQKSVYRFLQRKPDGQYHQPEKFIAAVKDWYLDIVEEELNAAMGLVDSAATGDLFSRYVDHVTHHVRREKRLNPVTGRYEDADPRLMAEVEHRFGVSGAEAAEDFRTGIMHRIAKWRIDNPDHAFDLQAIFADRIRRLNDAFYAEKRVQADRIKRELLTALVDGLDALEDEARQRADHAMNSLRVDFGYDQASAVEVISYLLKSRPPEQA
ncbi:MAG: serine protein kinase PrkA [Myxococcales bacterium]|nr:serine protein kinase PrkA [Myxococcales bacterium]